jgi:ADP-ribosylglycohydrolase
VVEYAERLARLLEAEHKAEPRVSNALKSVRSADDIAVALSLEDRKEAFTTWAIQATAYEIFDRYKNDSLEAAVVAAITEGGDTDSSASIVASMWALQNPDGEMPDEVNKLQKLDLLQRASKRAVELVKAA